jgi:hypothetical protein
MSYNQRLIYGHFLINSFYATLDESVDYVAVKFNVLDSTQKYVSLSFPFLTT